MLFASQHAWAGLPFCPGTHLQWEPCSEVGGFSGEYRASLTVFGGNIKDRIEGKLCACICAFGLGLYICKCMWRSEIDVSIFLS